MCHTPVTLIKSTYLLTYSHHLRSAPTSLNMLLPYFPLPRINMIDHELRFNPNRKKIKEWVSNGDIGEIQHINILNVSNGWLNPDSRPKNDWWSLKSRGGGRMGANGSHQVEVRLQRIHYRRKRRRRATRRTRGTARPTREARSATGVGPAPTW